MRRDPKKVTQNLYHYTTAHGLIGILAQKKIWATHINYLNDKKEFIDAVDKFRRQTEKYDPVLEILQIFREAILL